MKIKFFFLFLIITSFDVYAKSASLHKSPSRLGDGLGTDVDTENSSTETRPFFKVKDLDKPKSIIVGSDFEVTYFLLTASDNCKIPLEIKNVSKEEKRNTFSIEAYSYANKKYEFFITEKRSKPGEIVNTQIIFENIDCNDIKKINFYR